MFKERKKFALLSLLSALVVVSTAFVGVSIYAQSDDSELTTFEEEAINSGVEEGPTGLADDKITTSTASDDNATDDSTTIAADLSFLEGLQVCDVGTAEVSGETEVASVSDNATTPTVSVKIMTETEVAALADNETETASADDETSIASANCVLVGGGVENSTSTSNAADSANATSTASNATSASNMTSTDNATSVANATPEASNATSTASTAESEEQKILVIEGQDFTPGQVVFIFSEHVLLAIDDVDSEGKIEAKVPMPDSQTTIAGNETASIELQFVESGTQRTGTFEFDGGTLTAAEDGDIKAADGTVETMPAPSGNATSTNSTSNLTAQ